MSNNSTDNAQPKSITNIVERLHHANKCIRGEYCELTAQDIYAGLGLVYQGEELTNEEREEYHDHDNALETLLGDLNN